MKYCKIYIWQIIDCIASATIKYFTKINFDSSTSLLVEKKICRRTLTSKQNYLVKISTKIWFLWVKNGCMSNIFWLKIWIQCFHFRKVA